MKSTRIFNATAALAMLVAAASANADDAPKQKGGLGGFLKKLEQGLKTDPSQPVNAASPTGTPNAGMQGGQGKARDYNRRQCEIEGVIVREKDLRGKNVEGLVQQEFNMPAEQLFTRFKESLKANRAISHAFPNAEFYVNEFETRRIQALYASFVAYPEPASLALIIDEATNSKDEQTKTDATVALAFIHLQIPEASRTPGRGQQLLDSLGNRDHYTYNVYRARRAAAGEGVPKNVQMAMALLVRSDASTGGNPMVGGGGQKIEIDRWNFRATRAKTIVDNDPSRRQAYVAAEAFQRQNEAAIPSKPYGQLLFQARTLSESAIDQAQGIIGLSQQGVGVRATFKSMDQLMEQRKTDPTTTISPDVEADRAVAAALASAAQLSDDQKALLNEALAKRAAAVSLVAQARALVLNEALGAMGDMNKSIGMLPAIKLVNEAFYGSCKVYASWEQGARVSKLPVPDPKVEAQIAATETSKVGDF